MANTDVVASILATFAETTNEAGLRQQPAQRLVVPYFRGEFNRCVEHLSLNRMIQSPFQESDPGWYQVGMACRTNDTRKVEFGWHSTVFEMLTAVWRAELEAVEEVQRTLAARVVRLLVDGVGLDAERLRVTYCGGGQVLPGLVLEPDELGRSAFVDAGIRPANLLPICGPKNFVLFVGNGERAGPKYEVQYLVGACGSERWIEVATAIVDRYQLSAKSAPSSWELGRPLSLVSGCAFGLERLVAARLGGRGICSSPVHTDLLATIRQAAAHDSRAMAFLEGDCFILADLVRSSMFLIADGSEPDEATVEGRLIIGFLRRIRRKIGMLCIEDWERLLGNLEAIVVRHYRQRYPRIESVKGELVATISSLPWPAAWNPDSYHPVAEATPHA